MSEQVDRILKAAGEMSALPTIPGVAASIVKLSEDANVSVQQLASAIESDPALVGKILRFANSSYYRGAKAIVTLPQAIVRIGSRSTKLVALSFGLVQASSFRASDFDFQAFWFRTLTTAVAARRVANRSLKRLADEAFVTALMGDIGCPVMATVYPREYCSVERIISAMPKRLADVEQRVFGVQHPDVSAAILKTWQLPDPIVLAVGAHHDVDRLSPDEEAFSLAVLVSVGSDLADMVIQGANPGRIKMLAKTFRTRFSFGAEHVGLLLNDLEPEIGAIGKLLDVPLPPLEVLQAKAKSEALRMAMTAEKESEPDAAGVASC